MICSLQNSSPFRHMKSTYIFSCLLFHFTFTLISWIYVKFKYILMNNIKWESNFFQSFPSTIYHIIFPFSSDMYVFLAIYLVIISTTIKIFCCSKTSKDHILNMVKALFIIFVSLLLICLNWLVFNVMVSMQAYFFLYTLNQNELGIWAH